MSESETHICSGCNTTFTLRGYHSHISQTRDSLCRSAFDRLKKSYETFQLLEQAANSSDEVVEDLEINNGLDVNMELDSAIENRLDLEEDEELDGSDLESELDDIGNMVAESETGWEPPREGAPREDAGGENEEQTVSDIDSTQNTGNFDRYIIGDGYGVKPAARILYTDKYPSSLAGKALSHEESRDCVYDVLVGGGDNPWAPFRSKKDWEIARWAKFRGVGSTAFSEILAIDGVSLFEVFFCR